MTELVLETPRAFLPLLRPARYKGAYGGRGSGKSHFFAEKLIEDCLVERGTRAVCIREVQRTLKESAKRLIEDKLEAFGLGHSSGFKVFNEVIEAPGDGLITFQGMQDHNAESIKSLEGYTRAWVEEAQTLSARSLALLRPTIREPGSELWFSWNPRRRTDPVDQLLRGPELPTDAVVVQANWSDNPLFPEVLEQERLDCLRTAPEQYAHIWEGDYAGVSAGAYYARHLAEAREEGRIGRLAADPLLTLRLYWDIGGTGARADAVAIWVVQFVGREIRVRTTTRPWASRWRRTSSGSAARATRRSAPRSGSPTTARPATRSTRSATTAPCVLPAIRRRSCRTKAPALPRRASRPSGAGSRAAGSTARPAAAGSTPSAGITSGATKLEVSAWARSTTGPRTPPMPSA